MSTLTLARALTALIARRVIRIATIITLALLVLIFIACWALAYFFSPWWWLLFVPFVGWLLVFLLIRLLLVFIVRQIHSENMTKQQSKALNSFVDKIWELLEARATPIPIIVLLCLKDILLHRDVVTIKKFIGSSVGLKKDYQNLQKLF